MLTELPLVAKLVLGAIHVAALYYFLMKLDDIDWNRHWPAVLAVAMFFILIEKFVLS